MYNPNYIYDDHESLQLPLFFVLLGREKNIIDNQTFVTDIFQGNYLNACLSKSIHNVIHTTSLPLYYKNFVKGVNHYNCT